MLLYVAGPYSGADHFEISSNISIARYVAKQLWEKGHAVICPHMNTAHFEIDCNLRHEDYIKGDFQVISICDGVVFLPNWQRSTGAKQEMAYVKELCIPFWIFPDVPELHPTEVQSPIQVKAFREQLGRMNRIHLAKNADYSPVTIAGPGWVGIVTRIWDKVTRLMNLTGFKIILTRPTWFQRLRGALRGDLNVVVISDIMEQPTKKPKNESVEDTLIDLSLYGIIGKLYREGKWGI